MFPEICLASGTIACVAATASDLEQELRGYLNQSVVLHIFQDKFDM